jgi:hypothetical protein
LGELEEKINHMKISNSWNSKVKDYKWKDLKKNHWLVVYVH